MARRKTDPPGSWQMRVTDPEQFARWEAAAKAAGLSMAEFTRRALDAMVDREPCPTCGGSGFISKGGDDGA